MVQYEKFIPNVIEPSFGIGRIVYCLLEQNFRVREDKQRTYFSISPILSCYKVVVLPLISKGKQVEITDRLIGRLRKMGIACRKDTGSSNIGKRYARTDEMGIPFAVTVDNETLQDS